MSVDLTFEVVIGFIQMRFPNGRMERRFVLNTIAGGILLSATGCMQTSEQETTTSKSDENASTNESTNYTVSVTKRVESQSGLTQRLSVTNGGNLDYVLTCPGGDRKTASGSVTADEWTAFKQLVVNLDREGLKDKYECTSRCPQGIPPKHIQITVDGSTVSTVIEVSASIPDNLKDLISKITAFEGKIKEPTCE
jgi:hypothetical protein